MKCSLDFLAARLTVCRMTGNARRDHMFLSAHCFCDTFSLFRKLLERSPGRPPTHHPPPHEAKGINSPRTISGPQQKQRALFYWGSPSQDSLDFFTYLYLTFVKGGALRSQRRQCCATRPSCSASLRTCLLPVEVRTPYPATVSLTVLKRKRFRFLVGFIHVMFTGHFRCLCVLWRTWRAL